MGEKIGKLLTCDRCGKTVFLKKTGDVYTDGGYTKYSKYEERPANWAHVSNIGDLCPDCRAEYDRLKTAFLEGANNEIK